MAVPAGGRRRPRFTILVLVLLSGTILVFDAKDVPVVSSVRSGMLQILEPVGGAFRWVTTPVRNAWGGISDYDDLKQENARLRDELDGLRGESVSAADAIAQLERLKEQLNVPFIGDIASEVAQVTTGNFSSFDDDTAQIDKGSSSGIEVGMPVVTAAGLIGNIDRVSPNRSVVRLITDPDLAIGIKLKSDDLGVGRGRGAGANWVVDRGIGLTDPALKGDPVVTSGLERAKFPPGLPIGTIVKVTRDQGQQIQILEVQLAADLTRLDFVQVLKWKPEA